MNGTLRAALATAASSIVLGAAVASPAQASLLSVDPASCGTGATSQAFAHWLDPMSYELVPGGNFETAANGWTLSGGATVQPGNESFDVGSTSDRSSLALPPGSSATSPAVCTSIYKPTLRFFARNTGSSLSSLKVEVLYPGLLGKLSVLQLGVLTGSSWAPTAPLPVLASLVATLPGTSTSIAFRFTPLGSNGSWSIDDVYVDPAARR